MISTFSSLILLALTLSHSQATFVHHAARGASDSNTSSTTNAPYKDAWRDIDSRVSDLLSRMASTSSYAFYSILTMPLRLWKKRPPS